MALAVLMLVASGAMISAAPDAGAAVAPTIEAHPGVARSADGSFAVRGIWPGTLQDHGIYPTTVGVDNVEAYAYIFNSASPTGFGGYDADINIDKTVGVGTWTAVLESPGSDHALDGNGAVGWFVKHPNAVDGDAAKVTITIRGTNISDTIYILFRAPRVVAPSEAEVNGALGSTFPGLGGSITIFSDSKDPDYVGEGHWKNVSTLAGSTAQFHAQLKDQYENVVPLPRAIVTVTGRNPASKVVDPAGFSLLDTGSLDQATTDSPSTFDTITVAADSNNDGVADAGVPTRTVKRSYFLSTAIAAVDGGWGVPTEQFSSESPFQAKTSDDEITVALDPTKSAADQPVVPFFLEARDETNTTHFPSRVQLTAGLVGAENQYPGFQVSLQGGTYKPDYIVQYANPISTGADGFARGYLRSSHPGTQKLTLSAQSGGLPKELTIHWVNNGQATNIVAPTSSLDIKVGGSTTPTFTLQDRFGNPVAGTDVDIALDGPAALESGSLVGSARSDNAGKVSFKVNVKGQGKILASIAAAGNYFTGDARYAGVRIYGVDAGMPAFSKTKFLVSSDRFMTNEPITASIQLFDINGHWVPNTDVKFEIYVPGSSNTAIVRSDAKGNATFAFTPRKTGKGNVTFRPLRSDGVDYFGANSGDFDITVQQAYQAPKLGVSSKNGTVTLKVYTYNTFEGLQVIFYRKSGLTGQVVPLGSATVDKTGLATRVLTAQKGATLAIYGKLQGVKQPIKSPYTNTVAHKVG